ncbi:hypothetical protein [Alcanivorax sp.]|jgi:hypothetical protein|uniref:hypothetical protein n=1 Tax=Alcanivorax sp. TaxID=1872427 RepID=UPI0032D91AB2
MEIKKFNDLIKKDGSIKNRFTELEKIRKRTCPLDDNEELYNRSKGGHVSSFIKKIRRDCAIIILYDLKENNPEYFENFTALAYELFCKKLLGFSVAKKDILNFVNKDKKPLTQNKKNIYEFVHRFHEEHFKKCNYKGELRRFIFLKSRRRAKKPVF